MSKKAAIHALLMVIPSAFVMLFNSVMPATIAIAIFFAMLGAIQLQFMRRNELTLLTLKKNARTFSAVGLNTNERRNVGYSFSAFLGGLVGVGTHMVLASQ